MVGDVRIYGQANDAPEMMYFAGRQPNAGWGMGFGNLAIRVRGDPDAIVPPLPATVRSLDPDVPLSAIQSVESILYDSVAAPRFRTQLLGGFAAGALILAVVGLTSMGFWMMKASKNLSVHVRKRIDAYLDGSRFVGLVALSFLVVFREGIETALLMFGAGAETTAADATVGVGLGLLVAGVLGVGIMRLSWRIPLHRFFQVTGVALVVIGAGLFAWGIHRRSSWYATGFAVGAVALGGILPMAAFGSWSRYGGAHQLPLNATVDALLVVGLGLLLVDWARTR